MKNLPLFMLICVVVILGTSYVNSGTSTVDEEIRKPWYDVIKSRVEEEPKLKEFVLVRFEDNKITDSEYSDIMVESARLHQESARIAGEQYKIEYKKFLSE